ncbi:MAG: hypothetical protein U0792_22470 [Gemmataceae bacterium]
MKFDADTLKTRLEDTAYIHSGLHITFKNEISGETVEFANPGGLPAFLAKLVTDAQKPAVTEAAFSAARTTGDRIEVALQWTESPEEAHRPYVNGIRTPNGGTHENGLKSRFARP